MDFCDDCGGILEVEAGKSICCGKISQCQEENNVPEEIKGRWQGEQDELKTKMSLEDTEKVKALKTAMESGSDNVHYIGGVDISFVKGDNVNACSALVICNYPDLEVVYEDYEMIKLTQPYIPGYLAFREVEFLVSLFEKLKQTEPQYIPQVILVDGNGLLHPKEFGLACHLGVLLDTPCIGVAKKLFQVDGLEKNEEHTDKIKQLKKGGDTFPLVGESKKTLGMTLRSCDSSTNPVYVSPGHQVSLETAVTVVYKCCKHRIPEPVRKADINSREYLRVNFKPET